MTDLQSNRLVVAGLFFVGAVFAALSIRKGANKQSAKFAGVLFVLALAVLGNNIWVYALAVFVIATLITELEFLENLAAIFWNRSWAWHLRKATPAEVKAKFRAEAGRESDLALHESKTDHKEAATGRAQTAPARASKQSTWRTVEEYEEFEEKALRLLTRTNIFGEEAKVRTGVALQGGRERKRYILDAVVEAETAIYLIEVKPWPRPLTDATVKFLETRITAATELWQQQRGENRDVYGVFILPSNVDIVRPLPYRIGLLLYDEHQDCFTNLSEFAQWIKTGLPFIDVE